jgi:diamine N-acetyltransferase
VTVEPSFRLAAESDTVTLLKFMQAYYAFDGHGFDEHKAGAALTNLLRDPSLGRVWLILDGATPVGSVVIAFGYGLEWLGRDAFVDEFYLLQEYRGRGWGRKTTAFVEEAARSLNVGALHLEVVRQNTTALQVYLKLGFMDRESTFLSKWIARDFSKAKGGKRTLTAPALDSHRQPALFPQGCRSRVNFCYASIALPRSADDAPIACRTRNCKETRMLRWIARFSCFFALMLAASFGLAQSEFSAEIVDLQKPGTPTQAKIYFAKDKIRIESQNSGPRAGGAVIMNFATQTSTVLMAQQHMYMEMPTQTQSQRMSYASAFFRAGDVENACGDWQKMGHNGSSCHKVGGETVNGRNTVKYEATNASGEVSRFWLDPKLRFPVKWQGKNSDGELRNIQEGTQPASLFEVPAGFTKMDMGGMMQRPH